MTEGSGSPADSAGSGMTEGGVGNDRRFSVILDFRDSEKYDVVAFTATQIPNIDDRKYPAGTTQTIELFFQIKLAPIA